MLTSVRGRCIGLAVLAVALVVLAVWFGSLTPAPAMGAYASGSDLGPAYDEFVGQQVEVAGVIVDTDPLTIRTNYGVGQHARYEVRGVDRAVTAGDDLRVFGVARDGKVIDAERVVVVPQSGFRWAYGVSALAGVWVLVRVLRDWRFDREQVGLEPRTEVEEA